MNNFKKIAVGLAALLAVSSVGSVFAQEVTPVEDNDTTVENNNLVIVTVTCIQNGVIIDTDVIEVDGTEVEDPETAPEVQVAKDNFIQQQCGDVKVYVDSDVNETPTTTPTVTVTPTTTNVTNVTNVTNEVEEKGATVPAGPPNTGFGGM